MAANHKLTAVIKGRVIQKIENKPGIVLITFSDGSLMKVKVSSEPVGETTDKAVKAVRQHGTELDLDFEDGTTLQLETIEATSCVMLRDKVGVLEYAD